MTKKWEILGHSLQVATQSADKAVQELQFLPHIVAKKKYMQIACR